MTTTENFNELARQVLTTTPEEQTLILAYLSGMKYAKAHPDSDAAKILAEIRDAISKDADLETVKALTLQLADLTAERT